MRHVAGMLSGFQAKAKLGNSNKSLNSGVLINSIGVLSKKCMRGRPWEVREIPEHKGCWECHVRNLHLLVTLQAVI